MKLAISTILLFASLSAFGQSAINLQDNISVGVEDRRSLIEPRAGFDEAAFEAGAPRYTLTLESFEQQGDSFVGAFEVPFSWASRQGFIRVAPCTAPYSVVVGGREVGRNNVAAMPAEFNVTRYLERDTLTQIEIKMHPDAASTQLEGWGSEPLSLGEVTMISQPTMYVRDVELSTTRSAGGVNASIAIIVKSEALNLRTSRINYELLTPQRKVQLKGSADVSLEMRGEDTIRLFASIPDSLAWSAEQPNLFRLNLSTQYRGRHLEYISLDLGIRSLELSDRGELLLNGVPQDLKVAQIASDATPAQLQLLKDSGYNAVRVAAGAHNAALYAAADSMGLYMIATAPINTSHSGENILRGGNPSNDPLREGEFIERIDAFYNVIKLHSSVVALSIADSSLNGINLYESYLRLKAKEVSRPVVYFDCGGEWNSDKIELK